MSSPTQRRSSERTNRGRGVDFPKVFSPLRATHHVTSQSSLASWESASPSPVPFRGSCFTTGLHPPEVTPQRLVARLYGRQSYGFSPSLIPTSRLAAHIPSPLLTPPTSRVALSPSHRAGLVFVCPFALIQRGLQERVEDKAAGVAKAVLARGTGRTRNARLVGAIR